MITQAITEKPIEADAEAQARWINRELLVLLRQLRAGFNALEQTVAGLPTTSIPSGPAGYQVQGTYPDQLIVTGATETGGPTELDWGAVADGEFVKRVGAELVGGTPSSAGGGSTEGSIFSMVGPGGTTPIVAYDFTRYDASLTAAQNLTNANMSGNSAYDLSQVGSGAIGFWSLSASTLATPYGFTPFACRSDGGALCGVTGGSDYAATSGSPAGVQLLGAMTAEWLGFIPTTPTGDMILFGHFGSGETEATNGLYQLSYTVSTNQWNYFHESGAGVNSSAAWFTDNGGEASTVNKFSPLYMVITRDGSSGNVALYINGRLVGTPDDGSVTDFPTGGGSGNLAIGVGGTNCIPMTLGFRLFGSALTAANVREAYQRTFFGVSA